MALLGSGSLLSICWCPCITLYTTAQTHTFVQGHHICAQHVSIQAWHNMTGQYIYHVCSAGLPKPTIRQLMEELYFTVASEWFPIGTFLEISDGELNTFAQRCHDDPQKCLIAMLSAWLHRTNPPASWSDIASAVQFIGKSDIAQQIRQKYCEYSVASSFFKYYCNTMYINMHTQSTHE